MTGKEIHNFMYDTLCAQARAAGVGVEFMDPIVLMNNLRIHKTPEKDDAYYWKDQLLLRVRCERIVQGMNWIFFSADGKHMTMLCQEHR